MYLLIIILFISTIIQWMFLYRLTNTIGEELDKVWKAIDKINEGSYLIKDK